MVDVCASIDQGTSSTRVILFDRARKLHGQCSAELTLITPKPGWVELNPKEILESVQHCLKGVETQIKGKDINVIGVGITNQRETTILWDKNSGEPLHNAIVWLDMRTSDLVNKCVEKCNGDKLFFQKKCGLPFSTYFSALKFKWLIENSEAVRNAIKEDRCLFGTVDSWVIWNLTKGRHLTDVTNASRTMLMDLKTLAWDKELCEFFDIPLSTLPEIRSSSEVFGHIQSPYLKGVPISSCLGDQQAAVVGQKCFNVGDVKNTYGTGCFMLYNTGTNAVVSMHGLLTTVAYKLGKNSPAVYALEGSIAVAGVAIKWFRDNMGVIKSASEINDLAAQVENTGDLVFVPAFSGLFAPRWRDDARGIAVGITQFTTKNHFARAILEAPCYQTKEILEAMQMDSNSTLSLLKVDGGMSASDIMLQFQSDILGIQVVRPDMLETTAFGAAFAAGIGVGKWKCDVVEQGIPENCKVFDPKMDGEERKKRIKIWEAAVERSLGWTNVV